MNDKLSHVIWNFSLCFALGEQEGTAEKGDRWEWGPPSRSPAAEAALQGADDFQEASLLPAPPPLLYNFSLPRLVFQPSPIHFGSEIVISDCLLAGGLPGSVLEVFISLCLRLWIWL